MESADATELKLRQTQLDGAIEEAYGVFKPYPLTSTFLQELVDRSNHEESPRPSKVRELSAAQLDPFAVSALYTWGSLEEFLCVLPRMFELIAKNGHVGSVCAAHALSRLSYGNWRHWRKREQEAVENFLLALWRRILAEIPSSIMNADDALCTMGQAFEDLSAVLREWSTDRQREATLHLVEFINSNAQQLARKKKLGNAFWSDRRQQMAQAIDWLLEPETQQRLEQHFFRRSGGEESQDVSYAVASLESLRAAFRC